MQAALDELAGTAARDIEALPDRAEERIHDIRVGMKKFLAVLRLASAEVAGRDLLRLDKLARELKSAFGAARDRDVQVALLRQLLGHRKAISAAAALPASEAGGRPANEVLSVSRKLSAATARLDLRALTRTQILDAWAGSYREARRAAPDSCGSEDFLFHEWRKRVKQFLYQSAGLGPPADRLVPGAQELSSALGFQHDLAELCKIISRCGPEAERLAFEEKQSASRIALRLGRRLFRKKPRAMLKVVSSFYAGGSHE